MSSCGTNYFWVQGSPDPIISIPQQASGMGVCGIACIMIIVFISIVILVFIIYLCLAASGKKGNKAVFRKPA